MNTNCCHCCDHCCCPHIPENKIMVDINYFQEIIMDLNIIKSELENVKPKEKRVNVSWNDAWSGSLKSIDLNNLIDTIAGNQYFITYGDLPKLESKTIAPEITEEDFDKIYDSKWCIFKIQTKINNLDYTTYTKTFSNNYHAANTKSVEFIGHVSNKYINGYGYRIILTKYTESGKTPIIKLTWVSVSGSGTLESGVNGKTLNCSFIWQ